MNSGWVGGDERSATPLEAAAVVLDARHAHPDDALPHYLHPFLPELRPMLTLRDPAEIPVSWFQFVPQCRAAARQADAPELLHRLLARRLAQPLEHVPAGGDDADCEANLDPGLRNALYPFAVEQWRGYPVPVLFVYVDELHGRPVETMARVAAHLGVDPWPADTPLPAANESPFHVDVLPKTRRMLSAFFSPFSRRLAALAAEAGQSAPLANSHGNFRRSPGIPANSHGNVFRGELN